MKTSAILVPRFPVTTQSRLAARLLCFVTLMKPRVMALAVFTALVGMTIAPSRVDPLLKFVAIIAIAVGAGAAGVLNMWYDADIDAVMTRTAGRPIPRGKVSRTEALAFGLALAGGSVVTPLSCCQRGGSWSACFRDLLLRRRVHDVAKAPDATKHRYRRRGGRPSAADRLGGVHRTCRPRTTHPVPDHLPLDAASLLGARAHSRRRICPRRRPYTAGRCWKKCDCEANLRLQPSSAPSFNTALGARVCRWIYGTVAAACGAVLVVLAAQVRRHHGINQPAAHRLFAFSILYLFLLFAALLASGTNRLTTAFSERAPATVENSQATFPAGQLQTTGGPFRISTDGA